MPDIFPGLGKRLHIFPRLTGLHAGHFPVPGKRYMSLVFPRLIVLNGEYFPALGK